ncbi:MAG: ATPase, T2SS/T4P/T4SS family [Candidatus Sericytochromatia bacterium]|nr:ATPase, T2SS/T4P/T4SS family [Candidatus Sericytochromatia bacterium]
MAVGTKRIRLGELLIKAGVLTEEQLSAALMRQKETAKQIGETLIEMGFVTEEKIKYALEVQFGVKHINLKTARIPAEVLKLLPEQLLKQYMMIPVAVNQLTVALVDPNNILAIDEIRKRLKGVNVVPAVCTEGDFWETLKTIPKDAPAGAVQGAAADGKGALANMTELAAVSDARVKELIDAATKGTGEAQVVSLVNALLGSAVKRGANALLMEPMESELQVRYRVDGAFLREAPIPAKVGQALIQRIKVMAGLTVTSGHTPQQGTFGFAFESRPVKMVFHTLPAKHGQLLSIRVFDSAMLGQQSIDTLVLHPRVATALRQLVSRPSGLVAFAGPLAAGKTTLVYACLRELQALGGSMITVEEPVAADLEGVTQVSVLSEPGPNDLGVLAGINAALAQAPRTLLVSQAAEPKVGQRLVRGALAGTTILAGVHTTQALTVEAIEGWGLPPRQVANALAGTVTMRLIRRLCPSCKEAYMPDDRTKAFFARINGTGELCRPRGCEQCFKSGYRGMVGVYEVVPFTPAIREHVARQSPRGAIDALQRQAGLPTLEDYAMWLVAQGHTTWDEVKRSDIPDLAHAGQQQGAAGEG